MLVMKIRTHEEIHIPAFGVAIKILSVRGPQVKFGIYRPDGITETRVIETGLTKPPFTVENTK